MLENVFILWFHVVVSSSKENPIINTQKRQVGVEQKVNLT